MPIIYQTSEPTFKRSLKVVWKVRHNFSKVLMQILVAANKSVENANAQAALAEGVEDDLENLLGTGGGRRNCAGG